MPRGGGIAEIIEMKWLIIIIMKSGKNRRVAGISGNGGQMYQRRK